MNLEINCIDDLLIIPHFYKITETLRIAISLEIFGVLSNKKLLLSEIENEIKCKNIQPVLELLCNMKLLHYDNGYFYNSNIAKRYLCNNKKMLNLLLYSSDSNYKLEKMNYVMRDSSADFECKQSLELYMEAMHEGNYLIAHSVFRKLKIKGEKSLLDLGCGSGIFTIVFSKYNPLLKAVCIDKSEVIEFTKKNIITSGIAKQVTVLSGDFLTMKLDNSYDYILLSNVLHFYNANTIEVLLKRLWYHLNSQGKIIIVDIFDDRESIMNIMYSLEWLSNGISFMKISEMCLLLEKNQYHEVEIDHIKRTYSTLITAKKL